jgi:hypothetical protein
VLGLVFLGAWIYINVAGGWTGSVSGHQRPGSWSFPVYDAAASAAVVFFCVALWALSGRQGRRQVLSTAWLVWLLLATFPLSYWGEYGPLKHEPLSFRWGTLVAVGVGLLACYWSVASGIETPELTEIKGAQAAAEPSAAQAVPPSPETA